MIPKGMKNFSFFSDEGPQAIIQPMVLLQQIA
jgi:hypothetical protein